MEKDVRYFFCNDSDSDIKTIQDGQIEKLIDKSNIIHFLYIDVNNSIKDYLLEKLNFWSLEVDEEEYVMFVPSNNILLELNLLADSTTSPNASFKSESKSTPE